MLVDIVSRNGNLLLNFPLPGSGELDPQEREILAGITKWISVNSEGIYATRPWKVYGEGPGTMPAPERQGCLGFNERGRKPLTAQDIRFTQKDRTLYAFVMGWPENEAVMSALGRKSAQDAGRI